MYDFSNHGWVCRLEGGEVVLAFVAISGKKGVQNALLAGSLGERRFPICFEADLLNSTERDGSAQREGAHVAPSFSRGSSASS